jgi:hypothetical protein
MASNDISYSGKKTCSCCLQRSSKGSYLPLPDNKLRQQFICQECITKGTSAIVKNAFKIGILKTARVEPPTAAVAGV